MTLHYFLTSLPHLDINQAPPMCSKDFITLAQEHLSSSAHQDLLNITHLQLLNHRHDSQLTTQIIDELMLDVKEPTPIIGRYLYWLWLAKKAHSRFVRCFATDALLLHHHTSLALAHHYTSTDDLPTWLYDELQVLVPSTTIDAQQLANALGDANPAVLEDTIMTTLVRIVDDTCVDEDAFALDVVYAYFIKLTLCERRASHEHQRGLAILDAIVEGIIHERA